jgi:hypothetical protein
MFQQSLNFEEEEDDDDDNDNDTEFLNDKTFNNDDDLELFQQFNKLKLNFYKKYIKLYEHDFLNTDIYDDDDDEDFYDALSQSSFNIKK